MTACGRLRSFGYVKNEESLWGYQRLSEDGAPDRMNLGTGLKSCPCPSDWLPVDRSRPVAVRREYRKSLTGITEFTSVGPPKA